MRAKRLSVSTDPSKGRGILPHQNYMSVINLKIMMKS